MQARCRHACGGTTTDRAARGSKKPSPNQTGCSFAQRFAYMLTSTVPRFMWGASAAPFTSAPKRWILARLLSSHFNRPTVGLGPCNGRSDHTEYGLTAKPLDRCSCRRLSGHPLTILFARIAIERRRLQTLPLEILSVCREWLLTRNRMNPPRPCPRTPAMISYAQLKN